MKPELTPAKPWGFHLTGHLNLPHIVGLEGKRMSKELMGKKHVLQRRSLSEPAQASSAPTARPVQAPTSLHFTVNPLVSRISDRNAAPAI